MARQVTGPALQKLTQQTGSEPAIVIGINFGAGSYFFATRTLNLNQDFLIRGRITKVGNMVSEKRDDNLGSTGDCNFEIQDVDAELLNIINANRLEGSPCNVYLAFGDASVNDMILFLRGKVAGPIQLREGTRTLSLDVEAHIQNEEAGFSATRTEIENIAQEAEGVAWPMIFGKCAHVPALQVERHAQGYLKAPIRLKSKVYKINTAQINGINVSTIVLTNDEMEVYTETTGEKNKIYIRNHERFPKDEKIKIIIDDVVFEGKFNDQDVFEVEKAHIPKYEQVEVDDRGDLEDSVWTLRIKDPTIGLIDHHCYFKTSPGREWYNYCTWQKGKECGFKYPFTDPSTNQKPIPDMGSGKIIKEVYKIQISGLTGEWHNRLLSLAIRLGWGANNGFLTDALNRLKFDKNAFWGRPAETEVRLWNVENEDIYVVSVVPCEEIHGVYAYKKPTTAERRNNQDKRLMPIPKDWYTIELLDSRYVDAGVGDVTTIKFKIPFSDRNKDQEWENQIYVTATSTIGPNTANIIEYILDTWTTLLTDSSFDGVAAQIDSVPSNFALFDQSDALRLAQEIAWQARCVLILDSDIVGLRFLAVQPTALSLFSEGSIMNKTLNFGFTETADIYTRLIGTWSENYKHIPALLRQNQSEVSKIREVVRSLTNGNRQEDQPTRITVYKNNVDKFGLRTKEVNIYIYNEEQYIKKTLDFWGNRYSNSWRYVEFETSLSAAVLQAFDGATFSTNLMIAAAGQIEAISLNYEEKTVGVRMWLPLIAGSATTDSKAWPGA